MDTISKNLPVPRLHFRYNGLLAIRAQLQAPDLTAIPRFQIVNVAPVLGELTRERAALRHLGRRTTSYGHAE